MCCDPRLVKLPSVKKSGASSAKLARLMQMLEELVEEGRRVLLFSQFTSMLALIEERLAAAKIAFVKITGEVQDRATPVKRFQSGEVPVFLISLKAGGTGLNLTAADTVILYDPWWNPAVEAQAIDRSHRIGQDKAVFVHRLVTLNSNHPPRAAAGWHSSCGGGDGWFPVPGEEVGEAAGGVIGDAAQDVFEPGLWIDIVELGGGDQGVDGGGPLATAVGSGE